MSAALSLGLAGSLGPDVIGRLAPEIEAAGFTALWVNDTPGGDAIAALAAAARTTERLILASGVVPIDRRPAHEIADAVERAGLPPDRVLLGIGSGSLRTAAVSRVGDELDILRARLSCRVIVGALGPRMRRLGAERADGVLLNWVTPDEAARQRSALQAVNPRAHVALYVRTALDPAAFERLREETGRYASSPAYAANFARMGVDAAETVVEGQDALRVRLSAYRDAVDEVVARAITPGDGIDDYRAFLAAARGGV